MVLICMSIVSVLGSLMMREVAANYYSVASAKATVASGPLLESGVLLATDVLMRDMDNKDSAKATHRFEEWAGFAGRLEFLSRGLSSGFITGRIVDEGGKFPLQLMFSGDVKTRKKYESIFIRLVDVLCEAHALPQTGKLFAKSLQNWVTPSGKGTLDDSWYSIQRPSYQRSGRVFAYPAELLLVRWPDMTKEQRETVLLGSGEIPGLLDLVSVWGKEVINMNTAPNALVLAISPQKTFAGEFLAGVEAYRKNSVNRFDSAWYLDVSDAVGIRRKDFPDVCVGVNSRYYRVFLEAKVGASVRHLDSVFNVSAGNSKCLYRRAY